MMNMWCMIKDKISIKMLVRRSMIRFNMKIDMWIKRGKRIERNMMRGMGDRERELRWNRGSRKRWKWVGGRGVRGVGGEVVFV